MTEIQIKINGASINASANGILTSGMVGVVVTIEYDSSWDGLTKTASFRAGSFVRSRENIGTATTVPWEVMRHSGKPLEVGIEGRDADGNIVIPTVWSSVSKILPGANANIPGAPNPNSGEIPSGGVVIDDSQISQATTWSSQKISDEIQSSGNKSKDRLLVTLSDDKKTASNTSEQIFEFVQNGGDVVLETVEMYVPLTFCTTSAAYFATRYDDYADNVHIINEIAVVSNVTLDYVSIDRLKIELAKTVKTVNNVKPDENGNVQIETGGGSVELDTTLSVEGKAADAKAVGDAIGDISAVLAELHAYAEALKGGGAV